MKKNILVVVFFIALGGIAFWLFKNHSSDTIKTPLKNFAVEDTASIDKLFLAEKDGSTALVERIAPGDWRINKKYKARNDAINTLLYTIMNLEVRSPVGKNLYNNTMKLMASKSTKIEIYQKGQLVKTYYVGHPTMDNLGTFMYLEHSSVPFIMYIPGFNGYLSSRYFTREAEWRDRGIFRYDPRAIINVKVDDYNRPQRSFMISRKPDSTYMVVTLKDLKPVAPTDPKKLRDYITAYSSTNFEKLDAELSRFQKDSILKAGPFAKVSVTDDLNRVLSVELFRKPITGSSKFTMNPDAGKQYPFDRDKFYLRVQQDTSWYLCQYYHFDRILKDPQNFHPGKDVTPPQDRY